MNKKTTKLLINYTTVLLFVVFALIRLFKLGQIPIALYWDELAIGVDAYSVSQTFKDIHGGNALQAIYPSYGDYKAPLPILLTAISVKLFGLSEFSVRLPFYLMSLIGVYAISQLIIVLLEKTKIQLNYLPRRQAGFSTKLLIYLTIMTTPWLFVFSRIGYESGMSLQLVAVALLFYVKGLLSRVTSNQSIKVANIFILLGGIIGALSVYTYVSVRYILPLFLIILFVAFWKDFWQKKYIVLASLVLFIVLQIPLFTSPLYKVSQEFRLSTASVINDHELLEKSANNILAEGGGFVARIKYHRYGYMAQAFVGNYIEHFGYEFLFIKGDGVTVGDANLRHHSGWGGEMLIVTAPLIILGLLWCIKNRKNPLSLIIIGWLLVAPLTASLPYEVPHASRGIYMVIPVMYLAILGVIYLAILFRKHTTLVISITVSLLIINFSFFLFDYFTQFSNRSAYAWQYPNKQIGLYTRNTPIPVKEEQHTTYNFIITEDYRLPILSILFYQPDLILDLQQQAIVTESDYDYFWMYGFLSRQQPRQVLYQYSSKKLEVDQLQDGTTYIVTPDEKYSEVEKEILYYPDGVTESLYIIN